MAIISRGFTGRRPQVDEASRLPPGQYLTGDFPVLSAGPTPKARLDEWTFEVLGLDGPRSWSWDEFTTLPAETITVDIHCVTKWSKFDTVWTGVSVDHLLQGSDLGDARFISAFCDGGYTTNLPLSEVMGGKAWVAYEFGGEPLEPAHGGPARLLVPHLYFWKSAKWVRGIELLAEDRPGFWETYGYHNHGDPWQEQRYWGD